MKRPLTATQRRHAAFNPNLFGRAFWFGPRRRKRSQARARRRMKFWVGVLILGLAACAGSAEDEAGPTTTEATTTTAPASDWDQLVTDTCAMVDGSVQQSAAFQAEVSALWDRAMAAEGPEVADLRTGLGRMKLYSEPGSEPEVLRQARNDLRTQFC